MKKLLTSLLFILACSPAIQSMERALPAETQKKYDNLVTLIQNADVELFKPAFDDLTLPAESIAALQQVVTDTKTKVTQELEALGDGTKSWSKIIKGGLLTYYAGSNILISSIFIYNLITGSRPHNVVFAFATPAIISLLPLSFILKPRLSDYTYYGTMSALSALIACKTLPYALKTFKDELNYKDYLQNILANLDSIEAHINQKTL
jgi:hypothetical protein